MTVAIVTGAAGGLGREIVQVLHEGGAAVVAEDIDPAVAELESERIAVLEADVAQAETARRAVALAIERFGGLDVLVNNAARFLLKPIADTTDEEFDGLMSSNVRGAFVHCREALPALTDGGTQPTSSAGTGGAIVNVASISGLIGLPDQTAYCVTKGAIVQLTRQLAIQYARAGVRVNAVAPGAIDTPFVDRSLGLERDPERLAQIGESHPVGRVATPAEIAETIAFLASPRASYVTGAILAADGGYTAA
jgi:NAD(P)-dependent dehydrogenase (short-subunit alcohol dehydrogenase family)